MPQTSIQDRITNALDHARKTKRRTLYLGTDARTGAMAYSIHSSKGPQTYLVKAYTHPQFGGYRYGLEGTTQYWLTCTCEAARLDLPCVHGARLALRLQREEKQRRLSVRLMPYVLPCVCPKCGAENEPDAEVCSVCGPVPEQAHREKSKAEYRLEDMFASA